MNTWRAGCGANSHVRFGGRSEETGGLKGLYRVSLRPYFTILEEEERTLLLVNPQHMRAVPGKKTDVRDSEWLADLLRHGLLRASFIPPAPIRAIRELTRYRKTLVQERVDEATRLQKPLEGANLKLAAVASDVLGVSGRAMLAAVLDGERDPDVLAELARGVLRAKLPQLRQALNGRVQPHHLVLISQLLAHIDFLEQAIAQVQVEIERCLPSFDEALELLQTIPGVRGVAAAAILAEIGADMSRFPTAGHLVSWAGLCPSNKESAGKRMKRATEPWQRLAAGHHGRGRLGEHQEARHVFLCAVQSRRSTPRTQQGSSCRGAQPAGRGLSRPENRQAVPRTRRRLLRST